MSLSTFFYEKQKENEVKVFYRKQYELIKSSNSRCLSHWDLTDYHIRRLMEKNTFNVKIKDYNNHELQITRYKDVRVDNLFKNVYEKSDIVNVIENYEYLDVDTGEIVLMTKEHQENVKIKKSIMKTRGLLYDYFITNQDSLKYFLTFTIEPSSVKDRTNNDEMTRKISNWLRNHKRKFPEFNWVGVKEFHKKVYDNGKQALHFHILSNGIGLNLSYSENKTKRGQKIYNINSYHYGWNSAVLIDEEKDNVFKYMLKYISKDMINNYKKFNFREKKILRSQNIRKPMVYKQFVALDTFNEYKSMIEDNYYFKSSYQSVYVKSFRYVEKTI